MGASKQLRCLSWVAVSTEKQARDGLVSLPDQRAQNRQFIASIETNYYGYSGILVEELVLTDSRQIIYLEEARQRYPEYDRLYRMILDQAFDLLVTSKWDRLGRSETLVYTILSLCLDNGIVAVSLDALPPTLDVKKLQENESWRIITLVQSWDAGREVRELNRRITEGRRGSYKSNGLYLGEWPYGYRYIYANNGVREVIADPDATKVIRRICLDLFASQGMAYHAIAAELNQLGIPSPRGGIWQRSTIYMLLKNAWTYAGRLTVHQYNTDEPLIVPGRYPAILTEAEAAQVEAAMQMRANAPRHQYLFSKVCYCAECKQSMYGDTYKYTAIDGEVTHHRYMFCKACKIRVKEDKIRAAISNTIDQIQSGTFYPQDQDEAKATLLAEVKCIENEIAQAVARTKGEMDKLEAGVPMEDIDTTMFSTESVLYTLRNQLSRAQLRLESLPSTQTILNEIAKTGHQIWQWAVDEPAMANQWLRNYIRVSVGREGNIEINLARRDPTA